ncbi:MAG: hypothetical protein ABIF10_02550 [Candidatus Woesearchaeota archaeon]
MAKQVFNPEALKENIAEIKDRVIELEECYRQKWKDKFMDAEKKFEEKVEEHPVQSVAIAFGAGLAVGALAVALMKRK